MLPRRAGFRACYSWPDLSQHGLISRHRVPRPQRQTGETLGEKSRNNPDQPAKKYMSTQWDTPKVTVNRTHHFPGSRMTRSIALSGSEKPKAKVAPQVEDQHVDGHGVGKLTLQPKVRAAVARTNLLDGRQPETQCQFQESSDSDSDFDPQDVTKYLDSAVDTTETVVGAVLLDVVDTLNLSDTQEITDFNFVTENRDVADTVETTERIIAGVLLHVMSTLDLSGTHSLDLTETQDATNTDTAANLNGLEDIDEESMEQLENGLNQYRANFTIRQLQYAAIHRESRALLQEIRGIFQGLDQLRQQVDERMGSIAHLENSPADPSDGWEDPAPDQPPN